MAIIYIDEGNGIDAHDTQGTEAAPFKSLLQAYLERGPDDEYQVKKKDGEEYKPAAKSALKKAASYADNSARSVTLLPNERRKKHTRKRRSRPQSSKPRALRSRKILRYRRPFSSTLRRPTPGSLDSFERATMSQRKESCVCAFKDVFSVWPSKVVLSSSHCAED